MATVSINDVKTYLGITYAAEDSVITSLVTVATSLAESYCRTIFGRTDTQTDYFSGGGKHLFLSHLPVVSITSVTDNLIVFSDYLLDEDGSLAKSDGSYWTEDTSLPQRYAVSYIWGYSSIPADIRDAIVMITAALYNRRDSSISSQKFSETTTSYQDIITPAISVVLDRYKTMAIIGF